ncbi:MAG: DedA family protein, partial [Prochlorococcaceae cyanobacterium]
MSLSGFVAALPELIGSAVAANPLLGYGAIALVMLLENVFPPIPSELIMPLAGFYVHEGRLALVPVVLAGLVGTVLGAWFWYGVGTYSSISCRAEVRTTAQSSQGLERGLT